TEESTFLFKETNLDSVILIRSLQLVRGKYSSFFSSYLKELIPATHITYRICVTSLRVVIYFFCSICSDFYRIFLRSVVYSVVIKLPATEYKTGRDSINSKSFKIRSPFFRISRLRLPRSPSPIPTTFLKTPLIRPEK